MYSLQNQYPQIFKRQGDVSEIRPVRPLWTLVMERSPAKLGVSV